MRQFKTLFFILLWASLFACSREMIPVENAGQTFCNPLNLSYRFGLEEPSRREAADPTVILFKDKYFLFASKSGGYWHSSDLLNWTFIETNQLPTEEYAPTVVAINDTLYFLASSNEKSTVYKSANPLSGNWQVAVESLQVPVWDPAFFVDDNQRLYLYWGCSNQNPIYGVEVDYKNNFSFIGERKSLIQASPNQYGWEVPGDYNTKTDTNPWIEGSWINKHNGKYYLQYSGPGTEYKSYADAVYVADSPLGPYALAPHNPFSYKPEGFATGAGHGSTFQDKYGNYWHIGTVTISVKHIFERRLALFPTFIDQDGILLTSTRFGDYPLIMPDHKIENDLDVFPGWMLLSYNKPVEVSSAIDSLPASNMTDENIRTYWAAQSGNKQEYAILDLNKNYDVHAIQVNFAEHNTKLYGIQKDRYHQYVIECSVDKTNWSVLVDKSKNQTDRTHDYFQLKEKINGRYLRIKNVTVPDGNFALSGFRVFGKGDGAVPKTPTDFDAQRNQMDKRSVKLSWQKVPDATGYTISYGSAKDKLYHHYIVYDQSFVVINSLNAGAPYYFTITSFNENGISLQSAIIESD